VGFFQATGRALLLPNLLLGLLLLLASMTLDVSLWARIDHLALRLRRVLVSALIGHLRMCQCRTEDQKCAHQKCVHGFSLVDARNYLASRSSSRVWEHFVFVDDRYPS